eukprot:366230-Chlamydomonas_euryale.AAC.14
MHGLNEQKRPLGLRHSAALATTFQGPGRSKNTASARPRCSSTGKPFSCRQQEGCGRLGSD